MPSKLALEYGLSEFTTRQIHQLASIGLGVIVDGLFGDEDDLVIDSAVDTACEYGLVRYNSASPRYRWAMPGSGVENFGLCERRAPDIPIQD